VKHDTARSRAVVNKEMYVGGCDRRDSPDSPELTSRSTADPMQVIERCSRRAWCTAKERLGVRRLSVPFCSPFQVRPQEFYSRDCILQLPYTVSNQVLRDRYEERNIKLFMYIRPHPAHLDDTADLARLRGRRGPASYPIRHLRSGRAYTPSHPRFSSAIRPRT
jgi:hypothetical protein